MWCKSTSKARSTSSTLFRATDTTRSLAVVFVFVCQDLAMNTCIHLQVVAIWEYDKRDANGAKFIYHGMRLISGRDSRSRAMIDYIKKVLGVCLCPSHCISNYTHNTDALGIAHGPAHSEVMYTRAGPVLVEVGARPHGNSLWPLLPRCEHL